MSDKSYYWYRKIPIPIEVKEEIKKMVIGDPIDSFVIEGKPKSLLKVDGATFRNIFIKNRKYLYKGDYTAPSNENDYIDAHNYVTSDGLAGFSISKDGWLVSLYSSYEKAGFIKLISKYVIKDAYKLVCIVTNKEEENKLVNLYKEIYGFKIYVKTINDIRVMREHYGDEFIDSFVLHNGTPYHIFMISNNASVDNTEIKIFDDYFEAEEYVNKTVKRLS